jgi:hypothetical protein
MTGGNQEEHEKGWGYSLLETGQNLIFINKIKSIAKLEYGGDLQSFLPYLY